VRHTPHFWQIVTVGILAFMVELVLLARVMRGWQMRDHGASSRRAGFAIRIIVLAVAVALLLPSQVVALVSGGRSALLRLIVGPWPPWWETMTSPRDQMQVLLLGAIVGVPPVIVAAITTVTAAIPPFRGGMQRTLLLIAAPLILTPFFLGVCFFLHRLSSWDWLPGPPLQAVSRMISAKPALDTGLLLAACTLIGYVAWLAWKITRSGHSLASWPKPRHSMLAGASMLAASAVLWWLSAPLASENRLPLPGHDAVVTRRLRLAPAIPTGISQSELYDLASKTRMGSYRDALSFPLVYQKGDADSSWGPFLELSPLGVLDNKFLIGNRHELRERLEQDHRNAPLLHPDEPEGSVRIAAPPDLSPDLLADVLAVVYDMGKREVRLVTGLPQTIQRPAIGPLSRMVVQNTTVGLARSTDPDLKEGQRSIPVSDGFRRYRDLLDEVLSARRQSLTPVLILGPTESECWGFWEASP